MRTLLLPMTDSQGQESVLSTAFHLAERFDSHLTGLFIRPDPRSAIPFMGEGLTADAIQDLVEASEREGRQRAEKAKATFEATARDHNITSGDGLGDKSGPSWAWQEIIGFIADRAGRETRVADLAILPQPGEAAPRDAGDLLHEVLYRSGRPLMMVPTGSSSKIGRRIVVAWNGSAESTRSVAAALPLLHRADSIVLLGVGEPDPDRPGLDALATYLGRHGLKTQSEQIEIGKDGVGATLIAGLKEREADLLVMGAFSHSRWREMVLGGVTRHAIQRAPIPVFMSH